MNTPFYFLPFWADGGHYGRRCKSDRNDFRKLTQFCQNPAIFFRPFFRCGFLSNWAGRGVVCPTTRPPQSSAAWVSPRLRRRPWLPGRRGRPPRRRPGREGRRQAEGQGAGQPGGWARGGGRRGAGGGRGAPQAAVARADAGGRYRPRPGAAPGLRRHRVHAAALCACILEITLPPCPRYTVQLTSPPVSTALSWHVLDGGGQRNILFSPWEVLCLTVCLLATDLVPVLGWGEAPSFFFLRCFAECGVVFDWCRILQLSHDH